MRALRVGLGVLIIVCVVGVAIYVVLRKDEGVREEIPEPTAYVSDFTFPDRSGNPVVFGDVEARLRIINFWASWSPYSKTELPALAELKKVYGRKIEVIALNRDANPNEGKEFFDTLSIMEEVIELYDQNDEYYKTVGGYNMPETIFVDENGGILVHTHGPMTYDDMKSVVDRLLQ